MTRKKSEETQKKDAERSIAYDKNNPEAKKSRANAYTERKRLELQGLKQEILDLKKENQELRGKVEEYEKRLLT